MLFVRRDVSARGEEGVTFPPETYAVSFFALAKN